RPFQGASLQVAAILSERTDRPWTGDAAVGEAWRAAAREGRAAAGTSEDARFPDLGSGIELGGDYPLGTALLDIALAIRVLTSCEAERNSSAAAMSVMPTTIA